MRLGFSHIRVLILLCSFLLVSRSSIAQYGALEDSVFLYRTASIAAKTDSLRLANNALLLNYLQNKLKSEDSFQVLFTKVKTISVKNLPKQKARILTWNIEMQDFSQRFFGLIQYKTKTGIQVIELQSSKNISTDWEKSTGDAANWLGAMYFDVVPAQISQHNAYLLLGWRGKDRLISQKVIDIIYFEKDEVKFGLPVFKHGNSDKYRVVFTYPTNLIFSLKYHPQEKQVVFDRFGPPSQAQAGNYAFYTPQLIFDAYKLVKRKWIFTQDVPVTMPERVKKAPQRPAPVQK